MSNNHASILKFKLKDTENDENEKLEVDGRLLLSYKEA